MRLRRSDGVLELETDRYVLTIDGQQPVARVAGKLDGATTLLMLLAQLDSDRGLDGTLAVDPPAVDEGGGAVTLTVAATSTIWKEKAVALRCTDEELSVTATVVGSGQLSETRLLGGLYTGSPRWGGGLFHSRWPARTLFVSSPDDPRRLLQAAAEPATIGVVGGDMPGRGHWFFTPAPFLLAGSGAQVTDPKDPAGAPWTTLELHSGLASATFSELRYMASQGGFSIVIAYDGQTRVDGRFTTPPLVMRFGAADPYRAIADHAERLRGAGLAPRVARQPAGWWHRPIFCGWGEQCRHARLSGGHPSAHARQEHYDRWLDLLAERGIVPGTIVVDDKWQATYGHNEPDPDRWPDMRGWIAQRHARDQRVLLWFKAWDAEGLPAEACVTDPLGTIVAVDPESAAYGKILRESMRTMLGADGLDADGLKVDFTAQTPSGPGLAHAGSAWGVALLHRLLTLVYRLAKEQKPDALVVTHTPNPLFADVTDMIRLNDLLRLRDVQPWAPAVAQMTHRARIASAVDDGLLIDTDDWCMPSKHEWRAWLAAKGELGVPALYYATGIDFSDEPFDDDDYAAIRAAWSGAAAGRPLAERAGA